MLLDQALIEVPLIETFGTMLPIQSAPCLPELGRAPRMKTAPQGASSLLSSDSPTIRLPLYQLLWTSG